GRQAGGAHVADHLALAHALSLADVGKARHVRVQRGVALAVVEDDRVAIAALAAAELHPGVAGGHDRGAGACGVVNAVVHAHGAKDRMAAAAEARAQAGELDRRADEAALERAAVGVVVLHLAVVLEAEAGEGPAASGKGGSHHLAAAHALALAPQLLDEHAVAVARLDLAGEVDVVLEDAV